MIDDEIWYVLEIVCLIDFVKEEGGLDVYVE